VNLAPTPSRIDVCCFSLLSIHSAVCLVYGEALFPEASERAFHHIRNGRDLGYPAGDFSPFASG
jgi:hypothetical protein